MLSTVGWLLPCSSATRRRIRFQRPRCCLQGSLPSWCFQIMYHVTIFITAAFCLSRGSLVPPIIYLSSLQSSRSLLRTPDLGVEGSDRLCSWPPVVLPANSWLQTTLEKLLPSCLTMIWPSSRVVWSPKPAAGGLPKIVGAYNWPSSYTFCDTDSEGRRNNDKSASWRDLEGVKKQSLT